MSGVTKDLDILKQLFENLSDTDKQDFLTSVSQKEQVKRVIESRQITNCPYCQSTHFVKNVITSVIFVGIVKSPLLNKQALFSTTLKKTLKSGKNTFIT